MAEESEEDFFLPDLCDAQNILFLFLFLILVAELLVFVVILANSSTVDFSWSDLGLVSLFVQWIVLLSAVVLCNLRPYLAGLVTGLATFIGYGVILLLTLIFSVLAEWLLLKESWGISQSGNVARNLIIAAVMTGIAFRYFFLQNQLRQQ